MVPGGRGPEAGGARRRAALGERWLRGAVDVVWVAWQDVRRHGPEHGHHDDREQSCVAALSGERDRGAPRRSGSRPVSVVCARIQW